MEAVYDRILIRMKLVQSVKRQQNLTKSNRI